MTHDLIFAGVCLFAWLVTALLWMRGGYHQPRTDKPKGRLS